jgi:hypothetical protein
MRHAVDPLGGQGKGVDLHQSSELAVDRRVLRLRRLTLHAVDSDVGCGEMHRAAGAEGWPEVRQTTRQPLQRTAAVCLVLRLQAIE